MSLRVAQCPVSWGVERADAEGNPRWEVFLDTVAGLGYDGVELGPVGYLPADSERLRAALDERGLQLAAGYLMEPLSDPTRRDATLDACRHTCAILTAAGARLLVLIDDLNPARTATAGRAAASQRLDDAAFEGLVQIAEETARVAAEEFGLTVVFHPHAGTFVEYRDEIDRFMMTSDPELLHLCIDSGHSAYAGINPVELLQDYADRLGYLHLKDVDSAVLSRAWRDAIDFEGAVADGVFCPLGSGTVDVVGLITELRAKEYAGWVALEQDRQTPAMPTDDGPSDDAARSLAYLRQLSPRPLPRGTAHTRRSR